MSNIEQICTYVPTYKKEIMVFLVSERWISIFGVIQGGI
jgi:hypothetical protein